MAGEIRVPEAIRSLVGRQRATVRVSEGQLVDFKISLDTSQERTIGELAKDILGFSNAQGGLLLFGVSENGQTQGAPTLDNEPVRRLVGTYVGLDTLPHIVLMDTTEQG